MDRRRTAIIYARVSSAKQAKEELPIASQIEVTMQRALEMGATVLEVFRDDGVSGQKSTRGGMRRAIDYCGANQVDFFLCWNSARFARDHLADGNFRVELKRVGTEVVEVADYIDPKNHDAWFFRGMRALINEKYAKDVARDTLRSLIKNAKDGFFNGGRTPLGYRAVEAGKRRRLEIIDEEAAIVRRVFALYLDGKGCKAIATLLNAEGVTKRGAPWSKGNVALLLANERYLGTTVFNRRNRAESNNHPESEWVRAQSHTPIIEKETFERAQAMLASHAPKSECGSHRSQHVFTGLMRCASCNAAMTTESATGRTQTYHYYNCSKFLKRGGCATRRMRADVFDNWLVGELVEQLFTEERIRSIMDCLTEAAREWATHRETERARIVAAMRKIEAAQARLFDVLESDEKAEASVIAPRLKQHRATLASLERELIELETTPEVRPLKMGLDQAAAFLKGMIYNAKSPTQVRTFMAGFIREIRVDGQKVTVDFQPEQIVNQPGLQLVHSPKSWLPEQFLLRTKGERRFEVLLPEALRRAA